MFQPFPIRFVAVLGLTAALVSGGGCAMFEDPTTRDESFSEAAGVERRPEGTARPFGVTNRGREIEGDLGVR